MPSFEIAHLQERDVQGREVNLIIVPLESSFEFQTSRDQQATIAELQARARGAGLAGTVCPVWENSGRMRFIAPPVWHPYFEQLSMDFVLANINRQLSW